MLIAKNDEKREAFVQDCDLDGDYSHHYCCSVFPDPVFCKKSDCGDLGVPR